MGQAELSSSDQKQYFDIPISFSDESGHPFPYTVYLVYAATGLVANASTVAETAVPGANNLVLRGETATPALPGMYSAVIHILIGSADVPVSVELTCLDH